MNRPKTADEAFEIWASGNGVDVSDLPPEELLELNKRVFVEWQNSQRRSAYWEEL